MGLTATDEHGAVTVRQDDVTLLRYQVETDASKPHADTVALPPSAGDTAGRNLVLAGPHDHQWHLGLFFCQKLVDGINCWESELYAERGRPHGVAEHVSHDVAQSESRVSLSQTARWRTDTGDPILDDRREITVRTPEDGGYLLTWSQDLEAVGETRRLSSETLHGHYSGLGVRLARSMTGGSVRLPDIQSPQVDDVTGPAGTWCDYSGGIDGSVGTTDRWTAGLTLMDHPENDHHPVRWFTANEPFGFLAANPTFETVLTVPEDDAVSWRWGVWVHAGTPRRDEIEDAYTDFVDAV